MKTCAMFGAACMGLTVALAAGTSSSGNPPSAGGRPAGRLPFTTDPNISARHLLVVADDRAWQPAGNLTPVVRRDGVACYGTRMLTLIIAVSARLTTGSLRSFDGQVVLDGRRPRSVAEAWPRGQGPMWTGSVVR